MTAQDITAPVGTVELGGKTRTLQFDHEQIRQTELCWQRLTGNVMGYLGILRQAEIGVYAAIFALCFGALASAERRSSVPEKERTTLAQFDLVADYKTLIDMGPDIVASAITALPKAGKRKKRVTPGDDSMPWDALYRRALTAGIADDAFWRMSPAALIRLTPPKRRGGSGRRQTTDKPAHGGSLFDCP